MLERTIVSLRATIGDRVDVMIVDDGSPARDLVKTVDEMALDSDCWFVDKEVNEGFAKTVNVGLDYALQQDRDAILVNSDIEFGKTRDWLTLMQRQLGEDGAPADVVGALLVYPNGLIQHAGIYFSFLTRSFDHRYRFGPGDLPAAQHAVTCPVTGALQFIRHSALEKFGTYDDGFKMGYEDVDYCLRVWLQGGSCVYQPGIRAVHYESFFRGRGNKQLDEWHEESWLRLVGKYADVSFDAFVPDIMWRPNA
jgi:GT2 family glycosyltransferase